ncbi:peptidoglycan recognition family protein [Chakrabartyella piscis]|uniref:peptidoglycan recognition protein family protein n=1 Tax=Chakrabartyella piscis TaxID=2918914 RepID=UPI0029584347|nr:peptidoglycan recognition family protein [Chakrabartyella piscis]
MSNSSLICHTNISPNQNSPRNATIDTISIHCMAGNLTVESCGALFAQSSRGASSNYGVGSDGRIALYVDEGDRSWCTSDSSNDNRAVTIEVASDSTDPYAVTDAAYNALIELCADICQRNGISSLKWEGDSSLIGNVDRQNMTVHRWFAAKACPGDYLYNLHGDIAAKVNEKLKGDEDMTQEAFNEKFADMRKELQDNDCGTWSEEARQWAIDNGMIYGSGETEDGQPNYMWADLLTREQMVVLFYRMAQKVGLV